MFEHYRVYHPDRHKNPGPKDIEWRKIEARLKDHPTDYLKTAIDGCHMTPHNLGQNENNQEYLNLELIMRDEKHVTMYHSNAEKFANRNPLALNEKTRRNLVAAREWLSEQEANDAAQGQS